nr:putative reverse transcriptase domain-containing protein [Tanacetum cinerariifolium]
VPPFAGSETYAPKVHIEENMRRQFKMKTKIKIKERLMENIKAPANETPDEEKPSMYPLYLMPYCTPKKHALKRQHKVDEFTGLLSQRQVEFRIDIVPGATMVAKSPYRLAPLEMQELSGQLQELQEKGFIQPIHSSWGAPVLFVKKKDGSF